MTDLEKAQATVDSLSAELLAKEDEIRAIDDEEAIFYAQTNFQGKELILHAGDEVGDFRDRVVEDLGVSHIQSFVIGPHLHVEVFSGIDFAENSILVDDILSRRYDGLTETVEGDDETIFPEDWRSVKVSATEEAAADKAAIDVEIQGLQVELDSARAALVEAQSGFEVVPAPGIGEVDSDLINANTAVFMPTFLLRAIAALSSLLGLEMRAAAVDLVQRGSEPGSTFDDTRRFFRYFPSTSNSYPFPDGQRHVFDPMDPIRAGFQWIAEGIRERRSLSEDETKAMITDWKSWTEILYAYCDGGVRVWDVSDLVSPSFSYHVETGEAMNYLVGSSTFWDRERETVHLVLPRALNKRLLKLDYQVFPTDVTYSYRTPADTFLVERKDEISALMEAALFGVDWEGSRKGQWNVVRNDASVAWEVGYGAVSVFEGLYFKEMSDLIGLATLGEWGGGKMIDTIASYVPEEVSDVDGKSRQWVYEKLGEFSKQSRVGGYNREMHVELVTGLRREICREIAKNGLIFEMHGTKRWIGVDGKRRCFCFKAAAEISSELAARSDFRGYMPRDREFVVREDETVLEVSRVSEIVDAAGDVGLLVLMACIEAGLVDVKGGISGYMAIANEVDAMKKDAGGMEKYVKKTEPIMLTGDVAVEYRFVFVLLDDVVIDSEGYGAPKGKKIMVTEKIGYFSDCTSGCKSNKIPAVHFEVADVVVG